MTEMRWSHAAAWPARIVDPDPATGLVLRSMRMRDAQAWRDARERNRDWLAPWDATAPPGAETDTPLTLRRGLRQLLRLADRGEAMPFVLEVDGAFGGQVTVNSVLRGSAQSASIGYWIDQRFAGRGLVPRGVALAVDHCFGPGRLHRVEIAIRPENSSSLRVVEKLELREFGYAPRYLHIDGDWRDHRLYAITPEECPGGLRARLA
ncbi:ribosomal-protein-alanine N-acetyltransferase [Nocardioides zeae]|uniref:Ribosomal-protein-alanine N-acetyltransferase n=1 Tax=Nocardioides zeae TaxID=1457234 RepID=A0ACC6IKF7_9ACTN|nr:ribosomal-protein-alanine N-acetyltransferase [Nocardioides zeae]MDR6210982.1 ribosomal-protein-alanine N-acetyltransferase [Nocardioides zeae]